MKKRYWIAGSLAGVATIAVVAKLLTRPRDTDWDESRDYAFHSDCSRFIDVEGVRLHYQEAGDPAAPALILIHGLAYSTLIWSRVFLPLAEAGFHVIAVDLMGFGYSSKPKNGEYTIAGQSKLIMGLLDRLGIDRAILVGGSYGGAVAVTCALDYPERIKKIVLVGAVCNDRPLNSKLMRLFGSPILGDVVSPLLLGSRRLLRWRMKRAYDRNASVLDERRLAARHLMLRAAGTQRAIIRTVRGWDAERITREAHLIRQPALLLWGQDDQDIPLADGEILHERIPGSRLMVFANCGHHPQEEFPEVFTNVVADFCRRKSA